MKFVFQRSQWQKFVTDFGVRFFFKEVSAKARAKAQNQFGGAWAQGPQAAPPNWVLGFGSGFGTDFFEKKSYTKVSDKFLVI